MVLILIHARAAGRRRLGGCRRNHLRDDAQTSRVGLNDRCNARLGTEPGGELPRKKRQPSLHNSETEKGPEPHRISSQSPERPPALPTHGEAGANMPGSHSERSLRNDRRVGAIKI